MQDVHDRGEYEQWRQKADEEASPLVRRELRSHIDVPDSEPLAPADSKPEEQRAPEEPPADGSDCEGDIATEQPRPFWAKGMRGELAGADLEEYPEEEFSSESEADLDSLVPADIPGCPALRRGKAAAPGSRAIGAGASAPAAAAPTAAAPAAAAPTAAAPTPAPARPRPRPS
eukprot:3458944-Pyramimonas_sp.AAC.1